MKKIREYCIGCGAEIIGRTEGKDYIVNKCRNGCQYADVEGLDVGDGL